ncbi:hypothetical protein H0X06_02495 [Candidatus Dependentiae bacterium]|nr:hypothetical protein [Candidatus Dependentiae bacterium]
MDILAKIQSLVILIFSMKGSLHCMQTLPQEVKRDISSLSLHATLSYDFSLFKKIEVDEYDDTPGSLAFSLINNSIVIASPQGTAHLYNSLTGEKQHEFTGLSPRITSIAFSPSGESFLIGSKDKTASLWNKETGKLLHKFTGHTDTVWSVAVSPDGKTALTGSGDTTARPWDVPTGKQLNELQGEDEPVRSATFSPNGDTIATILNHTVILWKRSVRPAPWATTRKESAQELFLERGI